MEQLKKGIGDRIKARREELGMSQDDLAKKIGVVRGTIFRYEGGQIESMGWERVMAIADALHTDPNTLCGWDLGSGDKLLKYVSNNRWSEYEMLKIIDFGEYVKWQRRKGDEDS
jgi:transcriptional regulator with XRE-family HTH domain